MEVNGVALQLQLVSGNVLRKLGLCQQMRHDRTVKYHTRFSDLVPMFFVGINVRLTSSELFTCSQVEAHSQAQDEGMCVG